MTSKPTTPRTLLRRWSVSIYHMICRRRQLADGGSAGSLLTIAGVVEVVKRSHAVAAPRLGLGRITSPSRLFVIEAFASTASAPAYRGGHIRMITLGGCLKGWFIWWFTAPNSDVDATVQGGWFCGVSSQRSHTSHVYWPNTNPRARSIWSSRGIFESVRLELSGNPG